MSQQKPRYPIPRYPRGWFMVARADELAAGAIKPLKYFGKDLVLFRTESGVPTVLEAFCSHLGAHLGHGGKVVGEHVRCPFHSWEFDAAGKCAAIPYAKRIPNKSAMQKWEVRERNGHLYVWHDIDGKPPEWELPAIPEWGTEEWTPYFRRDWIVRTHNQEMAENVVDTAHFKYVHGMKIKPEPDVVEAGYPTLRMTTKTVMETPMGDVGGQLEVECYGFGFSTSRFTGLVRTTVVASVTPIDDDFVHVRFSFAVHRGQGADIAKGIGRAFTVEVARQLEEDKPIWENKRYLEHPMLCDGDGPFGVFRRWCEQFYPEWYALEAERAYAEAWGPPAGAVAV
jgi:3-ketosteroid 9alpha-monooxygenase subunit A